MRNAWYDDGMETPHVYAAMLAGGRAEMEAAAVRCFDLQSYPRRTLLRWTGRESIGMQRNAAAEPIPDNCIIVHWDDDDWSHPRRIEEQVEQLVKSGADVVGYNRMLFFDQREGQFCGAWMYHNGDPQYALGTSLCYWRRTLTKVPFRDLSIGEDTRWLADVRAAGMKVIGCDSIPEGLDRAHPGDPRMIARIHGGNTSTRIVYGAREWARVPGWDSWCMEHLRAGGRRHVDES